MCGYPWQWTGELLRVDGPDAILPLSAAPSEIDVRQRAAISTHRFLGSEVTNPLIRLDDGDNGPSGAFIVVTDGRRTWTIEVLRAGDGRKPLLIFDQDVPPRDTELWIVKHTLGSSETNEKARKGVICFTPGTMIATPNGPRDILHLQAGDKVQTQDNGIAEILWMGSQHLSAARLRAMPEMRPVRLKAGALDRGVPDDGLLVSPDHRLVVNGAKARAIFGQDELLVAAKDLINDHTIIRDHSVAGVSYIHMLLEHHQIVFANGVPTESFHPAHASLKSLSPAEQARLFAQLPELEGNASSYGGFARRMLAQSDAALLRYTS